MVKTPVKIKMSLRVWGDSVVPEEVSSLLGPTPTTSYLKGHIKIGKTTGRTYKKQTGLWSLKSELPNTATFTEQLSALLNRVTSDLSVWDRLNEQHKIDLFCGVFLLKNSINQVFEIPSQCIKMLSDRHITTVFDCYSMNSRRRPRQKKKHGI